MGDVLEMSRFRRNANPQPAQAEITENNSVQAWLAGFKSQFEREMAGADLLYICLNRSLVETAHEGVCAMAQVIPASAPCALADDSAAVARRAVKNIPMRDIVSDILHSNREMWLDDKDRFAALAFEFRRRIDRYNRLCDEIARL